MSSGAPTRATIHITIFILSTILCSRINGAPTSNTNTHLADISDQQTNKDPIVLHDQDVFELEQLKDAENRDQTSEVTIPELEKQLEKQAAANIGQPEEEASIHSEEKIPVKLFPGAARLTMGQNPEIEVPIIATSPPQIEEIAETVEVPSEITKNGQRRSPPVNPIKLETAESLLKHHSGGQYSAFDMAQYVFWTGDEAGVARAVEEFIQEGLMTREKAIKFLRDIRMGIEYLQSSYDNRPLTYIVKGKPLDMKKQELPTTSTTTTTTTTTIRPTTEKRFHQIKPTISPAVQKVIEKLKLNELNDKKGQNENSIDYDEMAGRMRLADFLYAEYSLEEVIYQLAKVMFSQSLTRGSDQAQNALQRLTGFLESEGIHGRISPPLQKKILDVLLAALSDTLVEHPELLKSATNGLGGGVLNNKISSNKSYGEKILH